MDKDKNENPTVALAGTTCAFATGIVEGEVKNLSRCNCPF